MRWVAVIAFAAGLFISLVPGSAHAQWTKIDCAQSKISIDGMKGCSRGPDDQGATAGCHTEQYSAAYGWQSPRQAATTFAYIVDRNYNSSCFASIFSDSQLTDILRNLVHNSGKIEGKNFSTMQAIGGARGMRVDWPMRKCFVFHVNGPSVMLTGGGAGFSNYVRGYICGPTDGTPLSDDAITKFISSIQVKQ